MGGKASGVQLRTSMELRSVAQVVNRFFAQEKAQVEPVDMGNNPLDALEGQPDLAVVAYRQGMMNQWAVQVYFVRDGDGGTILDLVALGDGGMARAFAGTKNSLSLSKGTAQRDKLISVLTEADPHVRVV